MSERAATEGHERVALELAVRIYQDSKKKPDFENAEAYWFGLYERALYLVRAGHQKKASPSG